MKKNLIFLSIIVVTALAVSDLKQRMSELDGISKHLHVQTTLPSNTQQDNISSKKDSDNKYPEIHK